MTDIRIADGDSREDFVLINERELYRRVAMATASDMGREAANVGMSIRSNPFRDCTQYHAAWRVSWVACMVERGYRGPVTDDGAEVVKPAWSIREWIRKFFEGRKP